MCILWEIIFVRKKIFNNNNLIIIIIINFVFFELYVWKEMLEKLEIFSDVINFVVLFEIL